MKVYAPDDKSFVTVLERGVEYGEEIDVDDELAEGLLAQGWTTKRPKAHPAARGGEAVTTDASDGTQSEEQ